MGVAASANLRPGAVSLFEAVHGSFPQAAGKGIANPLATINAVTMMLDYLGESEAAAAVEGAVAGLLTGGSIRSLAVGEHGTAEIGDMVVAALQAGTVAGA
jgi:isocitrate/isopropylmalate dehydrogenase